MPQEEDVLEDFGFNNVFGRDRTYLLGVYRGLYLRGKFLAEEIHEWRVRGILADKIKESIYSIPESCRRQYSLWFLQNAHVLERPVTKEEAEQRLIATFYDKARPYLDIEDRNKTARDLKPEAKRASYTLLAEILLQTIPNPMEENWYSFAFVTCRLHDEEERLVDLYKLLLTESDGSYFYEFHYRRRGVIQPATFTQFWKAHEAGTLIQLMDSKGLKELRSELPFLEGFLSEPPAGARPSVWNLKQFLEINNPMDHPPINSVKVDYGFINCRTFEERCTLMEIYREVLKSASALALHGACIAGALFPFASEFVRMEDEWRPLMGNFYPLEEILESEAGPEPSAERNEDFPDLESFLSRLTCSFVDFAD